MELIGAVGILLIIINFGISYYGFSRSWFFEANQFQVDSILIDKDYKRLVTSGFLHASWLHLIFNMMTLYSFCGLLELKIGSFYFLVIYFASLIGGNLLALYIHRSHSDYSAIGASGAVSGVIFASIALFPGMEIGMHFIEVSIPNWAFGFVFVLISIFGIKSNRGNIGHEAHLGGALVGMIVALFLYPDACLKNPIPILILIVPTLIFLFLIVTRPHILLIGDRKLSSTHSYSIDHSYNEVKVNKQAEIDKILDKINSKGIDSLSKKEKDLLDNNSK